jgi:hypothetical protein
MARVDIEDFDDKQVTRVYIAGSLREAKRVEDTLTRHGINYAVDIEPYSKAVLGIFDSVYAGAGFFVASTQAALARSTLLADGLSVGIEGDEVS